MIKMYAAGPIEGCTLEQANGWRQQLKTDFRCEIENNQLCILDPMHGKEDIVEPGKVIIPENYLTKYKMIAAVTGPTAIFRRDISMIDLSDIIYANFAHANTVSKGTMFELGYGFAKGKILIVVANTSHPFLTVPAVVFKDEVAAQIYIRSLISSGMWRRHGN